MQTAAGFQTRQAAAAADAIAPDGSEARILCAGMRGSMALFTLPPSAVARAVVHRTVEEVWYVTAGTGRMWRRLDDQEDVVTLRVGVSVSLPVGTEFQFRNDDVKPLVVVGVTMPPWPGDQEARPIAGAWEPTV